MDRRFSFFLALAIAVPSAFAAEFPRATTPYTADYVMNVQSASETGDIRGRIEVDGLKERHEHDMGGTRSTLILRLDKKVTWVLLPQQKMYFEASLDAPSGPAGQQASTMKPPDDVELREVGSETINGYATTKYEMTATDDDGQKVEGTLWLTEEKIPIRMDGRSAQGNFRRELSNVETGPIDPARFELPEGYNEFAMPQMPQGGGGAAMQEMLQKQMQQMMEGMKQGQ